MSALLSRKSTPLYPNLKSPSEINSLALPDLSVQYLTLSAKSQNLFFSTATSDDIATLQLYFTLCIICNSVIATMVKLLKLLLFKKNICPLLFLPLMLDLRMLWLQLRKNHDDTVALTDLLHRSVDSVKMILLY